MLIVITTEDGNMPKVIKIFNTNMPNGITETAFTQKGSLLAGTGSGTYAEFPPGTNGQVVGYNSGTSTGLTALDLTNAYPPLYKSGLTLSNNVSDANNDIDIATGAARDSTDTFNLKLTSGLTKRLDATWAAGTNQGGLDTGAKANSTWYHLWLIRKDSDGTLDVLFSTSATSPTMPSGYTYKRRIGAVRTNGSGNIIAFYQYNNRFMWQAEVADLAGGSATTATSFTCTVPTGIKVIVIGKAQAQSNAVAISLFDPDVTSASTPAIGNAIYGTSGAPILAGYYKIYSNISAQLKYYLSGAGSGYWYTFGWEELWQS